MSTTELMRGPALTAVKADDGDALHDLAREQRARLATLRDEDMCDFWLGGQFIEQASTWPFFSIIALMALLPITVLVAAFTLGPVLWVALALTVLSPLPYLLLYLPPRRRGVHLDRHGELRPAFVVHAGAGATDAQGGPVEPTAVLVGPALSDPDALQRHARAAARLRAALSPEGGASADADEDVAAFAATVRQRIAAGTDDGSRLAAPAALGSGLECAFPVLPPIALPDGHLTSALVFVLMTPARRGACSTRIVNDKLWGEGAAALCATFPWEVA
ncbi:MAG: hypothetical protein KDC98_14265 [Planctomycetes bacterium]|nr:hypothetical protein [Planctomycetota bacterium]